MPAQPRPVAKKPVKPVAVKRPVARRPAAVKAPASAQYVHFSDKMTGALKNINQVIDEPDVLAPVAHQGWQTGRRQAFHDLRAIRLQARVAPVPEILLEFSLLGLHDGEYQRGSRESSLSRKSCSIPSTAAYQPSNGVFLPIRRLSILMFLGFVLILLLT